MSSPSTRISFDQRFVDEELTLGSRDKILAMVLSTCEPNRIPGVVKSFPSAELLENLMHIFLASHLSELDSWIHVPTFRSSERKPDCLGAVIVAGAVMTTIPTVRKLGFALQEAVRIAFPRSV